MSTVLIRNIGTLVTGKIKQPTVRETSLVIEDGIIAAIGSDSAHADTVIDAGGLTAIPGLIDGHTHPTVGEWTPTQNSTGWIRNYLHGGTTSMISAGELHLPGLPLADLTADVAMNLALLTRATLGSHRPSGVKMHAGTLLLVPGLTEADFDTLHRARIQHLKFIFYDWLRGPENEPQHYMRWARERDMVVKMHSGGVSRSGSSRAAGLELLASVSPDVVAHISGGPIPMPDNEIIGVIDALPSSAIEVCSSMNYRATKVVVDHLVERNQLDRLTLGTDTPGGTGVIPRGMLRNICYLASMCGLRPEVAVAAATGNVAKHHRIAGGVLALGHPADIVLLGPVQGSSAEDALESFSLGDLPGISMILIDGRILIKDKSEMTPPPRITARVVA